MNFEINFATCDYLKKGRKIKSILREKRENTVNSEEGIRADCVQARIESSGAAFCNGDGRGVKKEDLVS